MKLGQRSMGMIQLVYGVVIYLFFLATLLYFIGFVNGWLVPQHIDNSQPGAGMGDVLVNIALLVAFAAQHTIMARPWFKRKWTRLIPEAVERSTFVLASSLILIFMIWQWRSFPAVLWAIETPWIRGMIHMLALAGYGLAIYATFLIDHFGLFGLRQVYAEFIDQPCSEPGFVTPWLYKQVRNPLMLGFMIGFWACPTMTSGRLLFNLTMTLYVFVGVLVFEERDLARKLGAPYLRYRSMTPMLLPRAPVLARWPSARNNG